MNTVTTLPRLGEELGKGGNGTVFKCYITTSDNDELQFACKVEKKKPLYRKNKMEVFEKICRLSDHKHFVVVHAYLIAGNFPSDYTGYLLMEYFPLGNINSILPELKALDNYNDEIKAIDRRKKQSQSDEEFGKYRKLWQTAVKMRDKIVDTCKRLWDGIRDSIKCFHDQNLVHLDIKDYNILLRKNCEHKDKFICECDFPPFDVLVSDFDYCHEINTVINKPKSVGTEVFQTPSMRDTRMKIATPLLDLFGLLLTVARIRSRMGSTYEGCSKMVEGWKEIVLSGGQLDYMLSEMFSESLKVKTNLESLAHTSQMHKCDECKVLKDQIAAVAKDINPEKKGISKFTTDTWKLGTNFCEYFLICTFVDMDSELLKYLIDTLNDILKDYKVTFEENQV